ncbi:MAG: helix-turn-helix domain-containing protein [Chthoniobacterales bacterium]
MRLSLSLKLYLKNLFFLNRFFQKSVAVSLLGENLKMERLVRNISISDAARAAQLEESIIVMLENDGFFEDSTESEFLAPGYRRLMALRYARMLGLTMKEIQNALPPLAPLNPPGRAFLKNMSAVSPKVDGFWKRQLSSVQHHSISQTGQKTVVGSFLKLLMVVLILVILLYSWNMLRYFMRAI